MSELTETELEQSIEEAKDSVAYWQAVSATRPGTGRALQQLQRARSRLRELEEEQFGRQFQRAG